MGTRPASAAFPLPRGWSKIVRSAVVQAIWLATTAMTAAWGRAATSTSPRRRLQAKLDRAETEIALLKEELDIKDTRWGRLAPRRRPHYSPIQRMQILELKAARGLSRQQTAERFLMTEETIATWTRRIDEKGDHALVQTSEPVNKFPDFVAHLVRWLKVHCPSLGKVRIADMLARAGLHLGATTVRRMLQRDLSAEDVAAVQADDKTPPSAAGRVVTAKYPGHVWHCDLTTIPTSAGFWVPWIPFSKPQCWPFCWWVAVAVDHASRLVVGYAVFPHRPASFAVCQFLQRATKRAGKAPRYIIVDKGKKFDCDAFRHWCRRRSIRPRYGAVGKHGSIAIVERFIRSMKNEGTRRFQVPFGLEAARYEIGLYITWFNQFRPHQGLDGKTPLEVYEGLPPANEAPRFEPRPRWPVDSSCAAPAAEIKGERGVKLTLELRHHQRKKHLPVVALKLAA